MTIAQVAKELGVNQEITCQLVKFGLIGYEVIGKSETKWISADHLKDFNLKYALLSKTAKAMGLNSKLAVAHLAKCKIYPVDHDQLWKLRQKVYLRTDITALTS